MTSETSWRDLVLAVGPFEEPNAALALAAHRGGARGVVDLGRDRSAASAALARLAEVPGAEFGVRVPEGCPVGPDELPGHIGLVVLAAGAPWRIGDVEGRRVVVEVPSAEEALAALAEGADGLVARGCEGGGRCGDLTAFVLLQRLLGAMEQAGDAGSGPGWRRVPVWARGGIGLHAAAAAVAGGASGVVLDTQLALMAEAEPGDEVVSALRAADGGETVVVDGQRVLRPRPLAPGGRIAAGGGAADGASVPGAAAGGEPRALPVGQDAALAARFADRYGTTGRAVRAVRAAVREHLAAAVRATPDGESSGRPPVVQGPMTRVSDQAGFAGAVAEAGGLPFLALSLLSGGDTRALLRETAERLGGLPWGAGLLGFAPAELRAEQLAAVTEARPPYAIIAGGRPAQAAPLEAAGIRTYLHAPSPGLLDQFLAQGARRFVFEGSECGGHVGPRTSFALWEEQIERLVAFAAAAGRDEAARLDVLFAGGVHDARSAAMVAAAAGTLTAHGARSGVLMGTAYLFTEEAVSAGAILPGFQEAALACEHTELLRTGPGHVTRCARTPFVDAFEAARADMAARGVPAREMWEELERLNLGRLRIAGKGVRRRDGRLVRVGEDEQRREGMFMLGQVAALRSAVTSVAALHGEVTTGAAQFLAARERESDGATLPRAGAGVREEERGAVRTDVAVVGMACVFPGAPDLDAYWRLILSGADAVTEVPRERWDPARYFDASPGRTPPGRTPSRWGGFLPRVPFDAPRFGIPPASLGSIEPSQLLALHVAAGALAHAGYGDGRVFDQSRTSVVFGAESGTDLAGAYGFRALYPAYLGDLPPELDAQLPALTEDSFPGVLANVVAGRVANRLDLGGVNYTVDAACAASLAAVDLACKELALGTSDMVLCGGVDTHNGANDYLMFASVRALSPSGRCATFDEAADGIALGEGAACVVLKRLADAERDGDRVLAVVRGVGGSSDGRSLGLTAPRPGGQRLALERAYRASGIPPARVGLVEAHGTGTVVGDRTELDVLTKVFVEHGAAPGSCALGSVKSQIGHTKCAAGLAGLIKAALAVHHGVRPPTLHLRRPNGAWDAERSPFSFDGAARPWAAPADERVAGVSAFGFGGTNFHAVLAGYSGTEARTPDQWPAELFCFRGATHGDVAAALDHLSAVLDEGSRPLRALAALAADRAARTPGAPVRVAFVAGDADELRAQIGRARDGADDPTGGLFHARGAATYAPGSVAFLYPGQGSQRPGMLADVFTTFPQAREALLAAPRECARAMFPPAAFTPDERARQHGALTDTRMAQPALGVAAMAVTGVLGAFGVRPDHVAGHSYGELAALWAAGTVDTATLLRLSADRAAAVLAAAGADPGAMAAVAAPSDRVLAALPDGTAVVAANHNTPAQTVVSGPTAALETAMAALRTQGLDVRPLRVACAFHSPVVAAASHELARAVASVAIASPRLPVWSNATAGTYPRDPGAVRELIARQVAEPVRFVEQVEAMYAAGARVFVEAGPGRALTGMVRAILGDRPHTAVACDVPGENGVRRLLTALAELAVAGVPVDTAALTRGRVREALLRPGSAPGWTVDGHLVRTADGVPVPGGLRPAARVDVRVPAGSGGDSAAGNGSSGGAAPGVPVGASVAPASARVVTQAADTAPTYGGSVHMPAANGASAGPAATLPATAAPPTAAPPTAVPPTAGTGAEAVVLSYLASVRELVAAQRDVVLGYLGAGPAGASNAYASEAGSGGAPAAWSPPAASRGLEPSLEPKVFAPPPATPVATAALPPVPAPPSRDSETAGAPPRPTPADVLDTVLEVVATRTGYPRDMLDPGLDLEADLSVDSIKRTEIIGDLALRLGLPTDSGAGEDVVEGLSRVKTINAIVAGVVARAGGDHAEAAPTPHGTAPVPDSATGPTTREHPLPESAGTSGPPVRHVPYVVDAPLPAAGVPDLTGRRYAVVDDARGVGLALTGLLEHAGADVRLTATWPPSAPEGAAYDGLIHLGALRPAENPLLPGEFASLRDALTRGAGAVLVVTGFGGRFGDGAAPGAGTWGGIGLAGFARTAALEFPDALVRVADVDPKREPAFIAAELIGELAVGPDAGTPVVGLSERGRCTTVVRAAPLAAGTDAGPPAGLGRDAVVLLTGGARGITARVALGLARATGCRIELIGRTGPGDTPEDPLTAAASDVPALRAALAAAGERDPARVAAEASRTIARREVRATMNSLSVHASSVTLHEVDVRDAKAVRAVVDDILARYGRLDGVVHGAGVLEDRLLRDKSPESFARVFGTKVDGARALAAALRDREGVAVPAFVALFGSVAGVFGNPGQADYAAANDALDTLARDWAAEGAQDGGVPLAHRVVAVDWGPWAASGGGMVTPELERRYARAGIPLVDPEHGVAALLSELACGDGSHVVYFCPPPGEGTAAGPVGGAR